MKTKIVLLSVLLVAFVIVVMLVSVPNAFAEMLFGEREPGHGCNAEYYIDTREYSTPAEAFCPVDKPYLRVYVGANYHGDATRLSLCQSPGGKVTLCGLCGPEGYGDRKLGPGLISECVSELDLP